MFNYLQYLLLIGYLILIGCFVCILLFVAYCFSDKVSYLEKKNLYECGFEPFNNYKRKLNIQFYLIGLLFLIFDLEITLLFPWGVCLLKIGTLGVSMGFIFILLLYLGFLYEWNVGALKF